MIKYEKINGSNLCGCNKKAIYVFIIKYIMVFIINYGYCYYNFLLYYIFVRIDLSNLLLSRGKSIIYID